MIVTINLDGDGRDWPSYFHNFLERIERTGTFMNFENRRNDIRLALSQFNGTVVWFDGPDEDSSGGATGLRLTFPDEAAFGMFVLKYT